MQIDRSVTWKLEKKNVASGRGGIQHTIENRFDQNDAKRVQQTNGCKQDHRSQRRPPIRANVMQQSHQSMAELIGFIRAGQTGFYSDFIVLLRAIAMLRFYVVSGAA